MYAFNGGQPERGCFAAAAPAREDGGVTEADRIFWGSNGGHSRSTGQTTAILQGRKDLLAFCRESVFLEAAVGLVGKGVLQ